MAIVTPSIPSGHFDTYREGRLVVHRYISPIPRRAVFVATTNGITQDPITNGVVELHIDYIQSGSVEDCLAGYTIDVGTDPYSNNVGTFRVRKLSEIEDILYVAETAPGEVPMMSGRWITVREERRPWYRFPYIYAIRDPSTGYINTFVEFTDYDEAYIDQNENIQPQANIFLNSNCAPAIPAGFHDPGQSYRTVTLYAGKSRAFAFGATISGYLWDVGDGTIVTGTSTSETIVVRFPASNYFRYISLTVEDSNGTTHTQYFPIFVHGYGEGQTPPIEKFTPTRDYARIDAGHEMEFEFWGEDAELTEDEFASGSGFCYWMTAEFGESGGAAPASYIGSYLGWVLQEKIELKRFDSTGYRIVTGGVVSLLDRYISFGQTIRDTGSTPDSHSTMQNLTVDRVNHYGLRRYTNVLDICNYLEAGLNDTQKAIDLKDGSSWSQLKDVALSGRLSSAGADSLNGIWMRRDYRYMHPAERSLVTPVVTITAHDWTDEAPLSMDLVFTKRVGSVKGGGGAYDPDYTAEPLIFASIAPGITMSYGIEKAEMPVQYLPFIDAQGVLNRLTGMYFAVQNSPYPDFPLKLNFPFLCIEPCWHLPIVIEWSYPDLRDKTLSAQFIITAVEVTHSNEHGDDPIQITWTLSRVVSGEPGETKLIETTTSPPVPPPPPSYPPYNPSVLGQGTRKIAVFYDDNVMRRTSNFTSTRPNYNTTNLAGLTNWGGGTLRDFTVRAHSPGYVGGGTNVDGWLLTSTHVQRIIDIFGTPSLATATALSGSPVYRQMQFERGVDGWGIIAWNQYGVGTTIAYTTDGQNWTEVLVNSHYDTNPSHMPRVGLWLDPHLSGHALVGVFLNTGSETGVSTGLMETFDYGATWGNASPTYSSGMWAAGTIVVPYQDVNRAYTFTGATTPGTPGNHQYKIMRNGVDISPVIGSIKYGASPQDGHIWRLIASSDGNSNILAFIGKPTPLNGSRGLFKSNNASLSGTPTFDTIIPPSTSMPYVGLYISGDNGNLMYVFGLNGALGLVDGTRVYDKKNYTTTATALGLCGG